MKGIVVGIGYMGKTHLASYASIPGINIAAIVDSNTSQAEEVARSHGCAAYGSLQAALEQTEPDFVDVCLPSTQHKDAAVAALKSGAHVLIEKPIAIALSDVDEIIEASNQFGRRVMVAHVCRFMPQYIHAKRIVEERSLGEPLFIGSWRESEIPAWSYNNWLQDRGQSGGTILDLTIHDIDIANWLFGEPVSFYSSEVKHKGLTGCSQVVSMLSYRNGAKACIEGGHLMPKNYPFLSGFRLVCENGALEWNTINSREGELVEFTENHRKAIPLSSIAGWEYENAYDEEIVHFIKCLKTGEPFRISLSEARLALFAVHELIKNGT